MKKLRFISVYELGHEPELCEWLDLEDDEYFKDNPLSFFEGDPDMINIFGYTSYFMDVEPENSDYKYIIVSDDVSDVQDYLERFFSEDFETEWQLTEPNDWDSFWHNEEKNETIAYRGGRGYVYKIWQFKNN